MGALIQYFKILFLLLTTGITIYFSFKNNREGLKYYMIFLIFSGFLGFARPIFAEEIILPIVILLGIFTKTHFNSKKISLLSLIILIYAILITIFSKGSSFVGNDSIFVFGFVILTFSNYLFGKDKYTVRALALLWLYAFSRVCWLIIHGGSSLFKMADVSNGGAERLLQITTGLEGKAGIAQIDPNYMAFITGIGVVLTLLFYIYRKQLYKFLPYKFIQKKWFSILLFLIGIIELWLTIRAISRGMILSLLAAFLTFLFIERKFKIVAISTILSLLIIFLFQNFINLILDRFSVDDSGGGRYEIWIFLWNYLIEYGKLFIGFGLNYPWWKDWTIDFGSYLGTHNSWITILFDLGLIGFVLLIIIIIKSLIKNYKENSPVNKIRIVMLVYIIFAYSSIEPLLSSIGWILLAICISYNDKNKFKKIIKVSEKTQEINQNTVLVVNKSINLH